MPPGPQPGVPPPFKRKMGRPTALTAELTARIVAHLMEFAFFETACALENVPAETGRDWLRRGKRARKEGRAHLKTEEVFANFSTAVDQALADTAKQLGKGILFHGKKDWKALAWLGKAKFPQLFGDKPSAVVVDTEERQLEDGSVEETTTVHMTRPAGDGSTDLTDDDYAEAAAFLLRRKRLKQAAVKPPEGGTENG